ncbi:MAG: TRAP transporter substrate-binding protein [Betaproteobacteria bacterium]
MFKCSEGTWYGMALSPAKVAAAAVVAVVTLALLAGGANAKEYKLPHSADAQHPNHLALMEMAKRIAERTKNEVTFKIFPNNELGSPPEQTEQLRRGVVEFAVVSPSQLDKYDRAFGVVFIPYQFDGYDHAYRTLDDTANKWLRGHAEKAGFEYVANFEWGFRALTNSRRAVNGPEDVKGMKLRVPPEIQIKAAMEALGAITATIAFPEVYTALATKTVDGQDNPVATDYSSKFFEVQKYLTMTKHVYTPMFLMANANVWKGLSAEQRQIISEEGVKAGNEARKQVQEKEKWYIAEMEKAGIQTTYPDVAKFRALMGPANVAIKEYVGVAAWDDWAKLIETSRKK